MNNIANTITLYNREKVPLSKLNLGLAFYARTYKLADPKCPYGYNCKATGSGMGGPISQQGSRTLSFKASLIK
jgi:GH18 family chitinase